MLSAQVALSEQVMVWLPWEEGGREWPSWLGTVKPGLREKDSLP
jgi:hypothetical protein